MIIAVIGLGYVGLPLALEFAGKDGFEVIGYDTDVSRIAQIGDYIVKGKYGNDVSSRFRLVTDIGKAEAATIFIITVPTPVDADKCPDLRYLLQASRSVASVLKKGDIVIYESTVYPGCTEEDCVPVLEQVSGLVYNQDFYCGYSPERINVGDDTHTLTDIKKITSGSTQEVAEKVDRLYACIIKAGTYKAPSIKVAEAAKAIENAQRDLNISFVNELALIFDKMGIDTHDVIEAASTKWNFFKFKPGLVGGHCIGVDPYYLTYKAAQLGYQPKVILSGRRVNESIAGFVADKVYLLMAAKGKDIRTALKILMLGVTFKEHCADVRNSRAIDLYHSFKEKGSEVDVYDPWADAVQVREEYSVSLLPAIESDKVYDAVVLVVAHNDFLNINFETIKANHSVIYDVKSFLPRDIVDGRL